MGCLESLCLQWLSHGSKMGRMLGASGSPLHHLQLLHVICNSGNHPQPECSVNQHYCPTICRCSAGAPNIHLTQYHHACPLPAVLPSPVFLFPLKQHTFLQTVKLCFLLLTVTSIFPGLAPPPCPQDFQAMQISHTPMPLVREFSALFLPVQGALPALYEALSLQTHCHSRLFSVPLGCLSLLSPRAPR